MFRCIFCFCLLGLARLASADPLSFDSALQIAARSSPDIAQQSANVEAARSASTAAGRLPDPKLAVGIENLPVTGSEQWSLTRDFMTMRLYLTFHRVGDAFLIMTTLPFALIGGFWLMYFLGYNMSVASAVGFIALGGVAAEIGVVMLVYLNHATERRESGGRLRNEQDLAAAIIEGAALRIRPIAMTVAVIIVGLLPVMWGSGTGSDIMRRIAAPMLGGMMTAPLLSMLVIPAAYRIMGNARQR